MPATSPPRWTAAAVRALIADAPGKAPRYELVDGELLVTPSPGAPHQAVVGALHVELRSYVAAHGLGAVFLSPADLTLRAETIVQPDLFVVPPGVRPGRRWRAVSALLLAVEVLSEGSRRHDRLVKRRLYQERGVGEYWIVDIEGAVVERWRPADRKPEVLAEQLVWEPGASVPALVIDLGRLWAEAAEADDQ